MANRTRSTPFYGSHAASGNLILESTKNTTKGNVQVRSSKFCTAKAADAASASTLTVGNGNYAVVTGAVQINHITTTGWTGGAEITLKFTGTPTLAHNAGAPPAGTAAIYLNGATNYTATANDVLTFVYDSTAALWREKARGHLYAAGSTTATVATMTLSKWASFAAPAAADLVSVVADVGVADGAQIIAAQPDYPRKLQLRVTDADNSMTGTVDFVGVGTDGEPVTQSIPLAGGTRTVVTARAYATVTSITVVGSAGVGGGDNIGVGLGLGLGLSCNRTPGGLGSVAVFKAGCDGANEAVGVVDAAAGTIEPTTAQNNAHNYDFWYTYQVTPTQAAHTHTMA